MDKIVKEKPTLYMVSFKIPKKDYAKLKKATEISGHQFKTQFARQAVLKAIKEVLGDGK